MQPIKQAKPHQKVMHGKGQMPKADEMPMHDAGKMAAMPEGMKHGMVTKMGA